MRGLQSSNLLFIAARLIALTAGACVPDYPEKLLADPAVLQHPAVVAAFEEVGRNLSALYVNTTRDGLSFAVVHASTPGTVYTFNNGTLKMNETETYSGSGNVVTSDSCFRVMSVSKSFAMASALVVGNLPHQPARLTLSLDTHVHQVLPEFTLHEQDWEDGGSEITLGMLASHTSGISRESYSTDFNLILTSGKADLATIGADWAGATAENVIESIATRRLMFAPGQRAAYSNAGISILGSSVAAHYNNMSNTDLPWSSIATKELLAPLNMTHTFFGPVLQDLEPFIGIPGGDSWADLLIGEGYNPVAGMWSSANDLAKYLHGLWLAPNPELITRYQRRRSLKAVATLPDGVQQVGPGWEIELLKLNTSANASVDSEKTYSIFGKSGDGGGWHSWIDVIPNLGYGVVILTQSASLDDYIGLSTAALRTTVHDILAPAFAEALAARTAERFAGTYTAGKDTGLLTDVVNATTSNSSTYARLEVEDQILYMRELVVNGTNALEAIDRLGWVGDTGPRLMSTERGVPMFPAEGAAENAEFGEGAQAWRFLFPDLAVCDWFDFDGYADTRGWPLVKVVLVENEEGVELRYPPFDVVVSRPKGT